MVKVKSKVNEAFNPVKEDRDGIKAKRAIWSTKSIELAFEGLKQGRKLLANPFYERNTKLLKGDLVFDRTEEEIEEWLKCKNDIIYFVEKYCKLMTPEGIKHVKLRDYQINYLRHLEKHRLSIYLACRQCGKCLSFLSKVTIRYNGQIMNDIPLYELYNMYDDSIEWQSQYALYKMYEENMLSKYELYTKLSEHLYIRGFEKIVNSHMLDNVEVLSGMGWVPTSYIHFIQPFEIYELKLDNGVVLDCADEHIVFDRTGKEVYVKNLKIGDLVLINNGRAKVVSINRTGMFVNMCDITVNDPSESYYTNGILSHNTTTSAIFMLHYILFNIDKNALVLGNKGKTAGEILDKAKKIYLEIPFFLKPGVYKWNEGEIVLDNGCRLMCEATTINSGISFTFHCVLADEFAHIQPNILEKFYNNLFPTITAGKARFMITSTQNGYNLFYRLYKAAEAGINEYSAFKTDWYEVPEWDPDSRQWVKRDEAWHQLQVANYGSEEAFNKQFGTNFDVSSNTLINQKIIQKRNPRLVEFVEKEMPGVPYSYAWKWHPNFDPTECKNSYLVMTTDIAEGGGGDSTVCAVHRLIEPGSNKVECIGYFKSNELDREKATLSIQVFISIMTHPDRTLLSFERNVYGEMFVKQMLENTEKNVPGCKNFDESIFVKYYNESGTKFHYGIKITSGNKTAHCMLYKEEYEKDTIINDSAEFMTELNNFTDNGNNKYAAAFGHDDMVMAEVQVTFVKDSLQYKNLRDDFETGYSLSTSDYIYNAFEDYDPYINFINTHETYFNEYNTYDVSIETNNMYKRLNGL